MKVNTSSRRFSKLIKWGSTNCARAQTWQTQQKGNVDTPGLVLYPVTSSLQRFHMFKSFSLQESLQRCNSQNVWHVPDPDGIFMFHRTAFFCGGQHRHGLSSCRQSRPFITTVLGWNHKTWNKGCVDVFTICLSEQTHTKVMEGRNSEPNQQTLASEKTCARDLKTSRS